MRIEALEGILNAATSAERNAFINKFQEDVWANGISDGELDHLLLDLAYDLDFYEPDERIRVQNFNYYGDERLSQIVVEAIARAKTLSAFTPDVEG